jgi:hypothetical protein
MIDILKTVIGTAVGGLIAAGASFLVAYWTINRTAEQQRKQVVATAFGEYLVAERLPLPRPGTVPEQCRLTLESCRTARVNAMQSYLFAPPEVLEGLAKSYGSTRGNPPPANLSPEQLALSDAIKSTRKWVSGWDDAGFNFFLPCNNWEVEAAKCLKLQ